jgi:glycosyltransferase involved in cell wall biosynthesis
MAAKDQGWDLPEVVNGVGLVLGEDVLLPGGGFTPNAGYPIDVVNKIYNASDVVMSTATGEGWGLSSVEAMACKVPVVFPDNTALTEIIGAERGYLVKSGETPNDYMVLPNDNEVLRPVTSVIHMAETLLHVHDNPEEAAQKAENAYNWVKSNLVWKNHIVPQWDKLLKQAVAGWVKSQGTAEIISAEEL